MLRRRLLTALLGTAGAVGAAAFGSARAPDAAPDAAKVVYHLADLDKVAFVLSNIRNHFAGMGGPGSVTIALVVHGPALKAFHAASASKDVTESTRELTKSGLALTACLNTMRAQNVTLAELLPGFAVAEKGGVVRLAKLQAQGYIYLRP